MQEDARILSINIWQNYICNLTLNDKGINANQKNDKIPNIYMNSYLVHSEVD